MGHYKGYRRLSTRVSHTPVEWLKPCSEIGMLANTWSGRNDLVVYGGEDSAEGKAVAAYYQDTCEIEVEVNRAFMGQTPEMLGTLLNRTTQLENPKPFGVIYHESLHAKHTNWDRSVLTEKLDSAEKNAFMLLEEVRIESRGVLELPNNKFFLRESAMEFALESVREAGVNSVSEVWQAAMLGALAIGRFDVSVLELEDVKAIHARLLEILGSELFDKLRAIWVEFAKLNLTQLDRGIELAKEWVALLREADPEGEGNQEGFGVEVEESEGEGEGEGQSGEGSLEQLIAKVADKVSDSNARAIEDHETTEKWKQEAEARSQQSKSKAQKQLESKKVFDKHNNEASSGSSSYLKERRSPRSEERAAAVKVAQLLEKAKYRERSITEVRSVLPVGKLNARAAVQNAALKSKGIHSEIPAWRHKTRKHTDDPTLRLGVMVDISGSMGSAMESMATTAWVLGEAGHRIQAKTAMVYFGSGVFPTLKVGQRLPEVSVYSAVDNTEEFGQAWSALDGELGLTFGDGVRILVVVSDGQFRPNQTEAAQSALAECKRNGVAVLWITPKDCFGYSAARLIQDSAWGVHLNGLDVNDIALSVGKAAAESLGKVSAVA